MIKVSTLALSAALLAGCGIPEEKYNQTVEELSKTKASLDQANEAKKRCDEKQAQLDAENTKMKQKLMALGQDMSTMTVNLDQAKKRMEEMKKQQEQAERRAAQFREMVAKFKSMIDAGKLEVQIRDGLMLVKLPDNILFDPGKTDIKAAGKDAIGQVTQVLSGITGRKFQVAGHTDNQPLSHGSRYKSNWELSTARAVEVVKLMIADGMDPKRLSAAGYGEQLPVANNDSDDGRRQNRRIEIVVVPNIEDLPPMDDSQAPKS